MRTVWLVASVSLLLASCARAPGHAAEISSDWENSPARPILGKAAPLEWPAIEWLQQPPSLAALRGKKVVVLTNVQADCTCQRKQMSHLAAVASWHADKVVAVAAVENTWGSEHVQKLAAEHKFTGALGVVPLEARSANALLRDKKASLVIDRNGIVVWVGVTQDSPAAYQAMDDAIAKAVGP